MGAQTPFVIPNHMQVIKISTNLKEISKNNNVAPLQDT